MDTLTQIKTLGDALKEYKLQLEAKEQEVSGIKDQIRELEEDILPTLMDESGIAEVVLSDSSKVICGDFVAARIKDTDTAFQWLRETNNDGIIKNEIKVVLDRGNDEQAQGALALLRERGIPAALKESIHPSTLKAFVKEALNNPDLAQTLPKEAFGVYEARKVTFK